MNDSTKRPISVALSVAGMYEHGASVSACIAHVDRLASRDVYGGVDKIDVLKCDAITADRHVSYVVEFERRVDNPDVVKLLEIHGTRGYDYATIDDLECVPFVLRQRNQAF